MTDIEIMGGDAWNRHQRILRYRNEAMAAWWNLAEELYWFCEKEQYEELGYDTYEEYLDCPDVDIGKRVGYRLRQLYEKYAVQLALPAQAISRLEHSKLDALLPYIENNNRDLCIAQAETLSWRDLRKWIKQKFRPNKEELPAKLSETEYSGNDWRLIYGEMIDICKAMPAKSFDAIVTDPPYPSEYLPLFSSLAEQAERLLVDGGVLVVMSGQTHLPEVYARLTQYEDLQYRWTVAYMIPGADVRIWGRTIWNQWKPVIVLTKGKPRGEWTIDVATSPQAEKEHHEWGQSLLGMTGLMDAFVLPESRILDPFVGGGTTIDAAINSGHTCVGIDNDPIAIKETLNRLNGRLT